MNSTCPMNFFRTTDTIDTTDTTIWKPGLMRTRCLELKFLTYPCVEFVVRLRHRASIYSCVQDGRTTLEQRPTEASRMAVIFFRTVAVVARRQKCFLLEFGINLCEFLYEGQF